MKKYTRIAMVVMVSTICNISAFAQSDNELLLADPTIHNINGKYYLAGTQGGRPAGFTVYESTDMKSWHATDSLPNLSVGSGVYGTKGFWAPQFYPLNGKMAMLYTANEQVAIAFADSITGKYVGKNQPIDGSEHNIDPFLFQDSDGKYYLYHVRFNHGNFIWVGEYDIENNSIVPGTLKQVFSNDQAWEQTPAFPCDPIMEGPTVIKLKDTYYLFYSANHFQSTDYAVGYATAPTPMGPWTKNPNNPIIHQSIVGTPGAGHGDVFIDNSGSYKYVYHIHYSEESVSPRKTRILPLKLTPTGNADIPYTITADANNIIVPVK